MTYDKQLLTTGVGALLLHTPFDLSLSGVQAETAPGCISRPRHVIWYA